MSDVIIYRLPTLHPEKQSENEEMHKS